MDVVAAPDITPPVITLLGANPLTVEVGVGVYSELGASATDDDPLFSGVVTVGGDTVDVDVVGGYVVTYTASDPSGNTTVESRMVDVVDTTAPVVTLNGVSPQTIEVGSLYSELGASATDNDPLFSGVVTVGGDTVDVDVVGGYVVTYTASDPSGNTTVESRIVDVVAAPDITPPVITLLGANPLTVEVGSSIRSWVLRLRMMIRCFLGW